MKKILLLPAIIGLLAVPSLVLAHGGTDDNTAVKTATKAKSNLDIRREDRRVDATTTSTVSQNTSSRDDDNDDMSGATVPDSSISIQQAKTIALGVFPGKTIIKVETESEHDMVVFSVRFSDSSRVDVRASDGVVVRTETDNEENEGSGRDDTSHHSSVSIDDDSGHHASVSTDINANLNRGHSED